MTSTVRYTEGPPRLMGKVTARIVVSNRLDEGEVRRGHRDPAAVRQVALDEVLVDTGATHLCLPAEIIQQLGLDDVITVAEVTTASGRLRAQIFRDVSLEVEGRSGSFDCIELPAGSPPLLGVVPLEALGLEPDLRAQRLRLLPNTGSETYLLAL